MKKIFVLVVSLFLCVLFANAQNNVIDNELQKILNQRNDDYIDVNIMFKSQMSTDDFAALNCKSDSKEVRREVMINEMKKFAEKSQRDVMSVIYAEERSSKVIDVKSHWIANFINCKAKADVIYQLASHPDVALITYNSDMDVVSNTVSETDSRAVATASDIYPHLTQIKADKVWDLGYTGKGVIVAVLDSGTNLEHADIKDHLWNGNGKYGYNVHSPNSLPSDEGSKGHGSHCAGIVCGDGTSGKKTGVAPDATLMTIKIIGGGRCTAENLVAGVEKAAELGANVISLSVGRENPDENRALFRQTFTNLLNNFKIAAAVACGNDGNSSTNPAPDNVRTPGDCPPPWINPDQQVNTGGLTSVISVGAVNENNVVSPSSSKGPVTWQSISGYNDYHYNPGIGLIRPDIAAPGENVYSIRHDANDTYWGKSGTSQAAPCVAGVMALMLEKNPDLTPADLCRIIETTAVKLTATKSNSTGAGLIDALAAVQAVNFNDPVVINPYAFTSTLNTGSNLNLQLTLINNGNASTNGNTTVTISENDTYTTIVEGSKTYSTMTSGATATATFVVNIDPLVEDNHTVTFTVTATNGNYSHTFNLDVNIDNEFVAPSLTAQANGRDINLTWNATNNATSYNIYRDGAFLENTTSTSYTDAYLEFGTIYAYTVTSKRGELESEHSLVARAQTEDNPDKPSPTNVKVNNGVVTWTNGADSKGSNIYRKDVNTSVETNIATNVNGASYTDNNWNSLADGIYQYGVANTYAVNEKLYEEGFENIKVTDTASTYEVMNMYWYYYNEGGKYNWVIEESFSAGQVNNPTIFTPSMGNKAAFIKSLLNNESRLTYLVSRQMDYTQHNGDSVKLSFHYITPAWGNDINTLKVMISTTSYNSGWTELWSSNKTDVSAWTKAEVDLSNYVGQQFYIAFVNVAGYGYCTGVDNINISVEGNSESRIEWSENIYKGVNIFVNDGLWSNTDNWSAKRLPNENDSQVIIDANATITSGDITVNSLTINEGGSLTLNNGTTLIVNNDFNNTDADAFIINDGAQVFQNNDDVAATFVMNIINPDNWTTDIKDGWQFIASPMKDAKIEDFIPTSSDYDLYKYDGTKDLEWLNHKNEGGEEPEEPELPELPAAPQNLSAEATSTSTISLSWNAVVGALSYNVYYDGDNCISTTNTSYNFTGLTAGTEYCYAVTAINGDGESNKSIEVCTKTITLAPQNLVANAASHSSIVLSWNTVTGAERYVIYKNSEKIASVTSTSYTVNGLNPATEYCFTVTAANYYSEFFGTESAKSTPACATTDITIPSAPQNVVAVATSPYSVTLTWDAVATAESYNIYLFDGTLVTNNIQETEYIFNGLTPGITYYYSVAAVNAKGVSEKGDSNGAKTPLPIPNAPSLFATAVGSSIELTWSESAGATIYNVYDNDGLVAERITETSYTIYDLEAGEHCFKVSAVNAEGGESDKSVPACATVTDQEPEGPIAEHVIIGDGNSTSIALPIYSNCAYSISQQIYTRAEIGQTGDIKSVSFKYKSGLSAPCTRTVKVYLQQTTKGFFTSGTDWVSMTNADLVYNGDITINGVEDEWVRIKLNTPFEYTGNNLVVCVYDYTGTANDQITFAADEISEAKSLYYYSLYSASSLDPSNVNKTGYIPSPAKRNQIRFSFVTGNEPAKPAAPSNLIVSAGTENSLTLTWDNNDIAENYNIYREGVKIGQTEGTSYTVNGLDAGTEYCYSVSAENETGESVTAEVCGTTVPAKPQNAVAESIDETTINLSWDPVKGATSYNIYGATEIKGITTRSYDITGLTTGETYCYTVTAVNELGESSESDRDCAVAENPLYNIIFTLYDLPYGDGWKSGSKITVSYGGTSVDLKTPTYNATVSTYKETIHNLSIPKGTEVTVTYTRGNEWDGYYENSFDVKCENGTVLLVTNAEELLGGETFTFVADCTPVAPNAPVLAAVAKSSSTIALSWNEVLNATSYNVYQDGDKIATVTTTSYNVEGLNATTEYCFTVKAANEAGESDASAEVCATTKEVLKDIIVETGTNNNPTVSSNYYLPVHDFAAYAMSQQIYTAEELGGNVGKINSIAFKLGNQTSSTSRQYEVYITHTNLNTFNGYNFVAVSSTDKVFDGDVYISGTINTWYTINLEEPFNYTGGNIIVTVYDKTGSGLGNSGYHTFYRYTTSGRSLYQKGSSAYNMSSLGTGTSQSYTAQIQLAMSVNPYPTAPKNLVATAESSSSISLTWNAVGVATSYNVYRSAELVANVTGTAYTVQGLNPSTTYCYKVSSVNEFGESEASAEVCATTKMLPPSAPTNLVATSNGENSIVLTWSVAATATSYNVYQGGNSVATGITGTSYTVEGLDAGTEYCFTVKAVNNGGESAASTEACAETDAFTGCYVTFTLKDKYGDGWNGNSLTVSYGTITKSLTVSSGKSLYEEILAIPQGANLTITYVKSQYNSWPEENSFSIAYESGEVITAAAEGSLSVTTTFGPFNISCTPEVPGKPELAATPSSSSSIKLKMSASGAETYNIYQGGAIIATGETGDTYIVSGLSENTGYCFTVVAVNEVGESEMSDEVCATTFASGTAIVAVGEGNIAQMSAPVYNAASNNFSLSQQIYTQSEIGVTSGNIKGVSFHQAAGNNNVRDIVVYMQNVDKASFDGNYDWITFSDSDIVYQGTFNFGVAEDWVTIDLQNEFEYTGGNLAIIVYDKTGTNYGYSYDICDKFYSSQINEWRGMYYTNENALNLDNVSSFYGSKMNTGNWGSPANVNFINNIKLTIETSSSKSSSSSEKMTDLKGGFDKANGFTSFGTELSRFETAFQQGVGYLVSYETETSATFKGTLNHEKSYTFNVSYDNGKDLANFHLIGNPFSFNMKWSNITANNMADGYAVVNENGGYEYATTGEIKVGDGFFVKATGANPSIAYNTRNRNNEENNFLNVIASGKAGNDNVIVNLSGKEEGFPKIQNFNEDIALVYVFENSVPYGVYNCNSDALEVELIFKATRMGEYNIHIEPNGEFQYITLVDKVNDIETNMMTSSYSFNATPKENGNRFLLKFAKDEGKNDQNNFVYQSGEELIIETEGVVQIIDVMGRIIYSNEVTSDNNRIDISELHSATYIVRLINGNGVKTQKIVVM